MLCSWGCGAELTARTIRGHFTTCPNRGHPVLPQPPPPSTASPEPTYTRTRAVSTDQPIRASIPIPSSPQRAVIAGLRDLVGRVEIGASPKLNTPLSTQLEGTLYEGFVEQRSKPSPFQQSEGNRAWLEELAKLKKIGSYDEGEATERFVELLRGAKLPQGFRNWSDSKKAAYLTEHVPLEEK